MKKIFLKWLSLGGVLFGTYLVCVWIKLLPSSHFSRMVFGSNVIVVHPGRVEIYLTVLTLPEKELKSELEEKARSSNKSFDELEALFLEQGCSRVWQGNFIEWQALNLEAGSYVLLGLNNSDAACLLSIENLESNKAAWIISGHYLVSKGRTL